MKTLRSTTSIVVRKWYVAVSYEGRGFCFGVGQRPSVEEILA